MKIKNVMFAVLAVIIAVSSIMFMNYLGLNSPIIGQIATGYIFGLIVPFVNYKFAVLSFKRGTSYDILHCIFIIALMLIIDLVKYAVCYLISVDILSVNSNLFLSTLMCISGILVGYIYTKKTFLRMLKV